MKAIHDAIENARREGGAELRELLNRLARAKPSDREAFFADLSRQLDLRAQRMELRRLRERMERGS